MEEEREDMRDDGMSDADIEARIQFEASYRVPNLLTKRYLGEPVQEMDTQKVRIIRYE
jgi:hypothetical protein